MTKLNLSDLGKRLHRVEGRRAARYGGLEVIFIPLDLDPIAAQAFVEARKAATPGKHHLAIEFVGPEGGPEEGTGPGTPEDDIY